MKYILKLNIIWRELSKERFNLIKVLFFSISYCILLPYFSHFAFPIGCLNIGTAASIATD